MVQKFLSSSSLTIVVLVLVAGIVEDTKAIKCLECISLTGDLADCTPSSERTSVSHFDDDDTAVESTRSNSLVVDYTETCAKITYFVRRGLRLSKIIRLTGLNKEDLGTDFQKSLGSATTQKPISDADCIYYNGVNPTIIKMDRMLRLPNSQVIGSRHCYCQTDLCNADELMRK